MGGELEIPFGSRPEAERAEERVRGFAREAGFTAAASQEMALEVREATRHVLDGGASGRLLLRTLSDEGRRAVELVISYGGPAAGVGVEPARTSSSALKDRHRNLALGGGALGRGALRLEIVSPTDAGSGTRVLARRWLQPDPEPGEPRLHAGFASLPCAGAEENGDAVILVSERDWSLAAVLDGLGHGSPALRASLEARRYVLAHARDPLHQLFRGVDRVCRGTRGVVMALVRFDWTEETVTMGNVGNVVVRVFDTDERIDLPVRRGFLGRSAPQPIVRTAPWPPQATMLLHTDGVGSTSLDATYREIAHLAPIELAERLLLGLRKERDDATILVVRGRQRPHPLQKDHG